MKTIPEPKEQSIEPLALQIWENVVLAMNQYTHDSTTSKFLPPEEMLVHIRPIAGAFAMLHFTPFPTMKEIYKSHLYALFYFSIVCGVQMYMKERSLRTNFSHYTIRSDNASVRDAKNSVMKQLADGVKIFPPINQTMDLFLSHMLTPRRLERLPLKNAEFDNTKFDKFMPVTLLWGYLFAREIIIDR